MKYGFKVFRERHRPAVVSRVIPVPDGEKSYTIIRRGTDREVLYTFPDIQEARRAQESCRVASCIQSAFGERELSFIVSEAAGRLEEAGLSPSQSRGITGPGRVLSRLRRGRAIRNSLAVADCVLWAMGVYEASAARRERLPDRTTDAVFGSPDPYARIP